MMNVGEVKRGKHAKIRKMKEKYADQDEEDRQMRMALTGSKKVQGFDIAKHQEIKHGKIVADREGAEEDEVVEEAEEAEGAEKEAQPDDAEEEKVEAAASEPVNAEDD